MPDDDLTADLYITACERLEAAGIKQYEISNFGREGFESRHNLKYWTRQPYLGFGVDAHSMLFARADNGSTAVRFATTDSLESYVACATLQPTSISQQTALEETFFLGLRLNRGLDLNRITRGFGGEPAQPCPQPSRSWLIAGCSNVRAIRFALHPADGCYLMKYSKDLLLS